MSTLEKTIDLLETMPEDKIETVYAFIRFIDSDTYEPPSKPAATKKETIQSMLGIAHEYANPALIEQEEGAFESPSFTDCQTLSSLKTLTVSFMQ
ncbi:MAG: hypothetical protein HFG41_07480 [Coprococcus sp.]|nr:hypothetical protein [Coprococcus sp.]